MHETRHAILVLALLGCGGEVQPTVQGSCDLRTSAGYCQDYLNVPAIDPYKSTCTMGGGVFSSGACPHAGAVGGCKDMAGSIVNWFYTGGPYSSEAQVMASCQGSGTFIAP